MPLLQMSVLDPPLSGLAKEGVKQPRGHAVGKRRVDEGKMRGWLNGRMLPALPGVVSSAGIDITSRKLCACDGRLVPPAAGMLQSFLPRDTGGHERGNQTTRGAHSNPGINICPMDSCDVMSFRLLTAP